MVEGGGYCKTNRASFNNNLGTSNEAVNSRVQFSHYFTFNNSVLTFITYLINSDWFPVHFDHVHNFNAVVCVLFSHELHKAVSLVLLGYPVLRHVYVHCNKGHVMF